MPLNGANLHIIRRPVFAADATRLIPAGSQRIRTTDFMRVDFKAIEARTTAIEQSASRELADLLAAAVWRLLEDGAHIQGLLTEDIADIAQVKLDAYDVGKLKLACARALEQGYATGATQAHRELLKAGDSQHFAWDESKHPRHPKGEHDGGRFADVNGIDEAKALRGLGSPKMETELWKKFQKEGGNLSLLEFTALRRYMDVSYTRTNAQLRQGGLGYSPVKPFGSGGKAEENFVESVRLVNSALEKMPAFKGEVGRVLFLGDDELSSFLSKYKPGAEITEPSFTSTTRGDVADLKLSSSVPTITMRIKSVTGRAVDVPYLTSHTEDKEVLFRSHTTFRVDSVAKIADASRGGLTTVGGRHVVNKPHQALYEVSLTELPKKRKFSADVLSFAAIRDNAADYFDANGFRMAQNLADGARAIIQQELTRAVRTGELPVETAARIYARLVRAGFIDIPAIEAAVTKKAVVAKAVDLIDFVVTLAYLNTLVRTNVFEALNEARFAKFTDPALNGFVRGLEYSAIMDQRTTEFCRHMDDRIYAADNPIWDLYRPPNHYNCRSLLIPVTKTSGWDGKESDPPTLKPAEGFARCGCDVEHYAWDESKHPRDPRGTHTGGQWASAHSELPRDDERATDRLKDVGEVIARKVSSVPGVDNVSGYGDVLYHAIGPLKSRKFKSRGQIRKALARIVEFLRRMGGGGGRGPLSSAIRDVSATLANLYDDSLTTSAAFSWDETQHPRGKTSAESTPGSFAPEPAGEDSPDDESFAWDESKHPRHPMGDHRGGEFAPRDSGEDWQGQLKDVLSKADVDYKAVGQPGVTNKQQLMEQAAQALPLYDEFMSGVATSDGFDSEVLRGNAAAMELARRLDEDPSIDEAIVVVADLKGSRIDEKAALDYGGDYSLIRDVVRGTVVAPRAAAVPDVIEALEARGMKLAGPALDRMNNPLPVGYRDVKLNVVLPNGHIGEILVMTPATYAVKMLKAHDDYADARVIESTLAKERRPATPGEAKVIRAAVRRQKKLYAVAWEKDR